MKRFKIGLQLYSVRDKMENDMEGTLRAVKEMGYECVEFAGYFGHSAEEVRAMCDAIGLEIISVHQTHDVFLNDTEASVSHLKTLGVPYCAIPSIPRSAWTTEYEKTIADIRTVSAILKENGIQLLYHNHEFEFLDKHGDTRIIDAMFTDLSPSELTPQLDVCWVHYAAEDPLEYIRKYSHMPLLHLKDFDCKQLAAGPAYALIDSTGKAVGGNSREDNGFEFRPIGYGRQDFPSILKEAENTKIQCLIVEQDKVHGESSLDDARKSREYLKSIGY